MIFINWNQYQISFQMCCQQNSKFLEISYSTLEVIKRISWKNLISIFTLLSQEKSIIFFCENRDILSMFISFFTNIFKPFLWYFPVIFFLQKFQYEYLDSPVPIIVGINESASNFKKRMNLNDFNKGFFFYHIE